MHGGEVHAYDTRAFTMFTLASDDVDSLHQMQLASLILTMDRMQLRTYLQLLAVAALSGS
jgi:hypothetical protein